MKNEEQKPNPFESILADETRYFSSRLDRDVARLFRASGLTVSTAESITGGGIGERLSRIPGASTYFRGGVICYHPLLKIKLAGVPPLHLNQWGEVSEQVAKDMAIGTQKLTRTHLCLSTTGIAGPASDQYPESESGRVFIGLSAQTRLSDRLTVKKFRFDGDRETVRNATVIAGLEILKIFLTQYNQETQELGYKTGPEEASSDASIDYSVHTIQREVK